MKNLLFALVLLFSINFSYSQVDLNIGATIYSINLKESSNMGLNIGFSYKEFYCDFSSNFAHGKGEELDFSSDHTYDANKIKISIFNIGYNINIVKNNFFIVPIIGLAWTNKIYEDPILINTYFYGKGTTNLNYELAIKLFVDSNNGFLLSVGNIERFKLCYVYRF